jgi:hypothetical protein
MFGRKLTLEARMLWTVTERSPNIHNNKRPKLRHQAISEREVSYPLCVGASTHAHTHMYVHIYSMNGRLPNGRFLITGGHLPGRMNLHRFGVEVIGLCYVMYCCVTEIPLTKRHVASRRGKAPYIHNPVTNSMSLQTGSFNFQQHKRYRKITWHLFNIWRIARKIRWKKCREQIIT